MAWSPGDTQIIARIERLERQVRMLAERTGSGFTTAQRAIGGLDL